MPLLIPRNYQNKDTEEPEDTEGNNNTNRSNPSIKQLQLINNKPNNAKN